jgi:hypothetical protein
MKLFISYSSHDRDAVKNLAQDLESVVKTLPHQSEFGVWFDQELIGGHDWWNNILSAIFHSDLFIFALTPSSLDSGPCRMEYTYANALNKRVLPILLTEGVNPSLLPSALQRLQFVDYRTQDKAAYQRLVESVVNLPMPVSPPDPLPMPPDAPVSPLAQIKAQLEAPSLDLDTQLKLVFQLKQYLAESDKASGARQLLLELSHHPDVRAAIAQDISVIIGNAPPPAPVTRQPQPAQAPRSVVVTRSNPSQPMQVGEVAQKPAGLHGQRNAILVGLAAGVVLAILSSTSFLTVEGYDFNFGYYYYTDYISICGSFIVWPAIGAGAGFLYSKFVNKPR